MYFLPPAAALIQMDHFPSGSKNPPSIVEAHRLQFAFC